MSDLYEIVLFISLDAVADLSKRKEKKQLAKEVEESAKTTEEKTSETKSEQSTKPLEDIAGTFRNYKLSAFRM